MLRKATAIAKVWSLSALYNSVIGIFHLTKWPFNYESHWKVKERKVPPPCLTDKRLGFPKYVQLKDVQLHYVENGNADQPLMLFLHGFPEFWYTWRHQMQEFSNKFRVVAVDMRGYGTSDKPRGIKNYKLNALVEDIRQLVILLGHDKCVLVGHDWGSIVGFDFVAKHPEFVSKYIVVNGVQRETFVEYSQMKWKQFFMSWYMYMFQMPVLPELYLQAEDLIIFDKLFQDTLPQKESQWIQDIEAYKYCYSQKGAFTPPINYYRATPLHELLQKAKPQFPKIDVPTLAIFGADDAYLSKELMFQMKLHVDNLKIKTIDKANHFVHWQKPHITNKYIWEFVK